ncbi:MAG: M23 family metallopeptidase [Spirochaetales bacterium]|nr:M23 family metallopeptidase [Spirochaetales bacterium]
MNTWRLLFSLLLFTPSFLFGLPDYPEIQSTYIYGDDLFKQHQNALDSSQKLLALLSGANRDNLDRKTLITQLMGELFLFSYTPRENDTIYTVAADFSLSPDTIASLNGLERAVYMEEKESLTIPSIPGLFIHENGGNELDRRMRETERDNNFYFPLTIRQNGIPVKYRFYPNLSFTPQERLYFISLPFRSPLDHYWEVTSPYGMRNHPVTGNWEKHEGIDVRAPRGTPIYAAEKATVIETTELDNYGILVILKHRGGYETRYAHLDEIFVKEGDSVNRGQLIALSGNTGISTGPHLHFEIRRNGQSVDPASLVSQGSR